MVTAREIQFKEQIEAWVERSYGGGAITEGVDDRRTGELDELWSETDGPPWSAVMDQLKVLRSEYIEQLAAKLESEPLAQKLALVDSIAAYAKSK